MTKDKEEPSVHPGVSGDELLQIVEEATPENPLAQSVIKGEALKKAGSCRIVPDRAGLCRIVPDCAGSCRSMKK